MRLRLILSFVLIVIISVLGVVLIARQSTVNEVRMFMFRGGMTSDELIDSLLTHYSAYGSWAGVESILAPPGYGRGMGQQGMGMGGGMMNQRLRLADEDGTVVYDTSGKQPASHLSSAEVNAAIPLEVDGNLVGYLLAEGGTSYSRADETFLLSRLNRAALTAGLIVGGISLLLALYLAYRLGRPVQALTQAAERLGEGDLSQRVDVHGDDELAMLGKTFNYMADSLQRAEESRRAMTADIAHELRNPLAVQQAYLEALQDGIYTLTPENLEPLIEQNRLLNRLVEDLRTLVLADSGQLKLEFTPTDIPALVNRIIEQFEPQAAIREIQIKRDYDPNRALPALQVDPMRVGQILSNLLSNALRHTPPGGVVVVSTGASDKRLQIFVKDSGPGIPEEELKDIFKRFYRVDKSRSRSEGGTGLGLAIARQLAEAHGGRLTAGNDPAGGAIFTLTLPF